MAVVDNTYFLNGELHIPNISNANAGPATSPTSKSTIDLMILKYERDLLLNSLGVDLYDELKALLDDEGSNALVGKWKDLVVGTNYTINGKKYRWDGLRGDNKQSLVAFYIKSEYLKNDEQKYTTSGMNINSTKNNLRASYIKEFVGVHSEFVEKYQGGVKAEHLGVNRYSLYTDKNPLLFGFGYGGRNYIQERTVQASLFQFLCDSNSLDSTAFPEFDFKFYYKHNRFGI